MAATSILSYSECVPNHFICMALKTNAILTTNLYLFPRILNTTLSSPTKLTLPYTFFSSNPVPGTGFEPAHPYERCHLKAVRLPISPPGHS